MRAGRDTLICLLAVAALVLGGCGDSDDGGSTQSADGPPPPLAAEAIAQARVAVQKYCAEVVRHLAGERGPPTPEEFDRVTEFLERLAVRAELSPKVTIADGSTPRLALGDLAENLEGSNCDSRLVERIDERLATLPPD